MSRDTIAAGSFPAGSTEGMPMTKEQALIEAAIEWWRAHRPLSFSEADHLANPKVNAGYRKGTAELAVAVAAFLDPKGRGVVS